MTVGGKTVTVNTDIASGATGIQAARALGAAINDANLGVGAFVNDDGSMNIISQEENGANDLTALSFSGVPAGLNTATYSAATAVTTDAISDINVSTVQSSQEAVLVIDQAIQTIDSQRASLGAVQNRFENTIGNLQNIAENVSAARGRIQDTDFAAETANLTKNQILQQAGTAILAQANQLPQAVLSLLG
jgi:flagellin